MFTLANENLLINSQRREEIKEKINNTNKIVKPNLKKKNEVAEAKNITAEAKNFEAVKSNQAEARE